MLTPGAMIDGALDLVKRHPVPILAPMVAYGIVVAALAPSSGSMRNPAAALLSFVALAVVLMGGALAWMLSVRAALDAQPDLGAAWRGVVPQYWSSLGTLLLWGVAVSIGLLLLVAPGMFLVVAWLPIVPVILEEGKQGPDALKRAWDLTEGHRWNVFLVVLLGVLAFAVASLLRFLPLVGDLLAGVAVGLVNGVLAAWVAVFYRRRLAVA
jgi:hypothetical protein